MLRLFPWLAPAALTLPALFAAAQTAVAPLPATPMPPDRAADSYQIYSAAMPLGETAGWHASLYLVQDTTLSTVPPDKPCLPPANDPDSFGMNPHVDIKAPPQYAQDVAEILADFDLHCHDRISLDAAAFQTTIPVRLLDPAEQDLFRNTRFLVKNEPSSAAAARKQFEGAVALYAFSQVFFNAHHTAAIVYATHWCGGLCGQGFWLAFTRTNDGRWKSQAWSGSGWIS